MPNVVEEALKGFASYEALFLFDIFHVCLMRDRNTYPTSNEIPSKFSFIVFFVFNFV